MSTGTQLRGTLTVKDVVAIVVGIVVGVGIFKTPSLVAANAGSPGLVLLLWALGGFISLVGALCYAELATAYPHPGGDYHYMARAFGQKVAFLFAWARMTVIQPGSIAILAFIFGDYFAGLVSASGLSSPIFAAVAIAALTAINLVTREGRLTQSILTLAKLLGLLAVLVPGIVSAGVPVSPSASSSSGGALGLAMIFVLLTYGGWNEAAYVSAELKDKRRGMVPALVWSLVIITACYLLANLAFLRVLGLDHMSASEFVAADFAQRVFGAHGARLVSMVICISALGAINGCIVTGARTNVALGLDHHTFRALSRWREAAGTPSNALLLQGAISLGLVAMGALSRQGFVAMVEYTAPVFWGFFFLGALSLIVLRVREPGVERPFSVPLYPLTPLVFCAVCLYMLRASLVYTGSGALIGLLVLFSGVLFLLFDYVKGLRRGAPGC
jgi:APA family basic amino acid/polyamine antiporter